MKTCGWYDMEDELPILSPAWHSKSMIGDAGVVYWATTMVVGNVTPPGPFLPGRGRGGV